MSKATSYLITTPNPKYAGKTLGIQFTEGRAVLHSAVLDKAICPSIEIAVKRFTLDFGYKAKPLDKVPEEVEAKAEKQESRKQTASQEA